MSMKLPRKEKKRFKKASPAGYGSNRQTNYNWYKRKRMVIVHNYTIAGIPLILSKQDINFIKNGLLDNPLFKNKYE